MPIRVLLLSLLATATLAGSAIAAEPDTAAADSALRFRFVGPHIGNRIAAIAGVPGDPSTYYAGAASGGVWKSTDGGNRRAPVFDDQPVAAGQIVYQFDAWHYVPAAEPAVNLVSTLSRQDIEAQIARHYLGETHGLELKSPGLPLAM